MNWQIKVADQGKLKGFQQAQGNLSNIGIFMYEDQDWRFPKLQDDRRTRRKLKRKAKEHVERRGGLQQSVVHHQYSGAQCRRPGAAAEYFNKLYEMKYDKPAIYEAL